MDKKIIVAGYIGLEGSLKIAKDKEEELKQYFSRYFSNQIKECEKCLVSSKNLDGMKLRQSITLEEVKSFQRESIKERILEEKLEENVIVPLGETGAFTSLWSALWNLCEMWKCGVEIEFSQIPIRQETIEICQFAGLNPYQLSSKGSYLIFTSRAEEVMDELKLREIPANIIGETTDKRERLIKRGDYIRHLPRPVIGGK